MLIIVSPTSLLSWTESDQPVFVDYLPDYEFDYFHYITGTQFDSSGNLYVSDVSSVAIHVFDTSYDYVETWSLDDIRFINDLMIHDDLVYLSTQYNGIVVLNLQGEQVGNFVADIGNINGVAVDNAGVFYVLNHKDTEEGVKKYNSSFELIDEWVIGSYVLGMDIEIDSNDRIFIEAARIDENPFTLEVKPTDNISGVEYIEFYVDEVLLCTDYDPDLEGKYECDWDTGKYHSDVRVVAYDVAGNSSELEVIGLDVELSETGSSSVFGMLSGVVLFLFAYLILKPDIGLNFDWRINA